MMMTSATVAHPAADLDELTLVRELTYRINTQLASAIDMVTAAAVRADNLEAKVVLGNVAELLREQANVHRVLEIPEGNALVDAAQYLRSLCLATTRSCLEPIGVHELPASSPRTRGPSTRRRGDLSRATPRTGSPGQAGR
jgi:hypothetical protein